MAVIFRPLVAGAVYLKKNAERLGRKLLAGGSGAMHTIIDGYLLRGVKAGDNAIVTAIDSQRFIAAAWWGHVPSSGIAAFINLDLPDAVGRLSPGYGGAAYPASLLGFYASDGIVATAATPDGDERRYGTFMQGPLAICRSALLTGVQAQRFSGDTQIGYITQILRCNAPVKLETEAPAAIPTFHLTRSLDPYEAGAGRVNLIEIDDVSLGVPTITPVLDRFSGPALEFGPLDGIVTFTAWQLDPNGFFDRRMFVARYRLIPVEQDDQPPSLVAEVVWSKNVGVDRPVDATNAAWFYPQTWSGWSTGAVTPPAVGESPQVMVLAQGFHTRPESDPTLVTVGASQVETYLLAFDWATGDFTKQTLYTFDTWQLNYDDLIYKEYIPSAQLSVAGQPLLFSAVRNVTYEIIPGTPDRKKIPTDAIYTKLTDIEHVVVDAAGVQTLVDLTGYFIAYGTKWHTAPILGTGRSQFTGYFTQHFDTGIGTGGLFGEYEPVFLNTLGDAPMFKAVCEYAPGVLVAVVSPAAQYLDATQDRRLALIDVVTADIIAVSDPILGVPLEIETQVQLSCFELGDYEDGVITRHAGLIVTCGDTTVGGVFVTHDFGVTLRPLVTSSILRGLNVHYLGSNISPAVLGRKTGSPPIKPPPVI
jgi:hypothetical protein